MTEFEPRPFGKYFLTERIAMGGMAEIYKAKTFGVDGFEKILAIKKILHHYSSDKEFITMLTDEAKLVVNLSHANIVQVYDLGRVDESYFISMEFIDGTNLRELIEKASELRQEIPTDIALFIAAEICKGLDYAHSKKDQKGNPLQIVHRDVSPQNILVSMDGAVKITDFGIAKAAMTVSQTNIGILKGKVAYMAPEQAFGKPIDGRSDLFSCGIILYELLTQERLFTGDSQMEVLKKIRNTRISVDTVNKKIPEAIRPALTKALVYSVKDRYQTAADFQVELIRILYAHFTDFTPKKLATLMHLWFHDKAKPIKPEFKEKNHEVVVISSKAKVVNIVHHEDVPEIELTEKSNLTQREVTVEEMLESKRKKTKVGNVITYSLLSTLVFLLFFYMAYKFEIFELTEPLIVEKSKMPESVEKTAPMVRTETPEMPKTELAFPKPVPMPEKPVAHDTKPEAKNTVAKDLVKMTKPIVTEIGEKKKSETKTPAAAEKAADIYSVRKQPDTNVATYGKLRIDSNPRGASVKINGVNHGITPIVVSDLKKREALLIVVTKKNHQTWSQTITLVKDRTEIKANLFP